jgi:hypothetical protein
MTRRQRGSRCQWPHSDWDHRNLKEIIMAITDLSCKHDVHELCHLTICECTCHGTHD